METLIWLHPDGERVLAELDGQSRLLIGRREDCDVMIAEDTLSGHHALLERDDDAGWVLTDLESSNGTEVDGQAIESAPVTTASEILLGGAIALRLVQTNGDETVADTADDTEDRPDTPSPAAVGASEDELALVRAMREYTQRIRKEIAKVIVGQQTVVDQVLMVLIAGGHGLLVGMPGMAKTLLVSTIARVLDMAFKRVQFTPDLMPSDITGTEILETDPETDTKRFRFIKGPIFCNLLLADEINRTPPKTQAALLEAMQEKRVTVGNETFSLEPPFFVLATQNPIEQEGTYPLPEAQQDRFMFNIWVDYPEEEEEAQIVKATTVTAMSQPERVLSAAAVMQLQEVVRKVPVSDHVIRYAIRLVRATRPADPKTPDFVRQYVSNGAGPRAGQFLILAAKARAVMEGRIHVSCNDVRQAAIPVLRHRLLTNFTADSEGVSAMNVVERLLETIEQPDEKDYA